MGNVPLAGGLKPEPEKVKATGEMPPPNDKQGVQCFSGSDKLNTETSYKSLSPSYQGLPLHLVSWG